MAALKAINSGLAFLLELIMLAAFAYWGFTGEKSGWMKWALGIGIPLAAAIVWGILWRQDPARRLNITAGTILSSVLFLAAAAALNDTGQSTLAIALALVVILNRILILLWKQW